MEWFKIYPEVLETLKFHTFQMFTKPQSPYVPTLFYEFYEAYDKAITMNKSKVKLMLKSFGTVEALGV